MRITTKFTQGHLEETFEARTINYDKYEALAYGSPAGAQLYRLIRDRWAEWESMVANASWRHSWARSVYREVDEIARALFVEAVWGFGVRKWLKPDSYDTKYRSVAVQAIAQMRNRSAEYGQVDGELYRGMYHTVPLEFGDLDRWLESLWCTLQCNKK